MNCFQSITSRTEPTTTTTSPPNAETAPERIRNEFTLLVVVARRTEAAEMQETIPGEAMTPPSTSLTTAPKETATTTAIMQTTTGAPETREEARTCQAVETPALRRVGVANTAETKRKAPRSHAATTIERVETLRALTVVGPLTVEGGN